MAVACCENAEIPRIKKISADEFRDNYLLKCVPVVIEGAVDHWPALHWSIESLEEKAGHNEVNVRANTNCNDYREGRKYLIRQTTFGKYLTDLKAHNARARSSYLAVQNIKKALPELVDDVPVPDYVGKMHGGPYLWIAPHGHYEYCHFDPDDGLLVVLKGYKQVRLFGCDVTSLYPNVLGSKGRTVQATVNCEDPDLEAHPLFQQASCSYTRLNAGDMLYIPAFCWHQVSSYDNAISVNMFFGDGGTNTYLTKVMKPPQWHAFSHWLLNIIEQNRGYPSFPRTLSRLPEAMHNFLINQWHETADEAQLQALVSLVMQYLQIDELPDEKSSGKHPPPLQIRGLLWRS